MNIKEEFKIKGYYWKKDLKINQRKIILALIFLIVAVILDYASGNYTDKNGMAVATDLILDHIPPVNLGFLFVWFYIIVIIAFFYILYGSSQISSIMQ